MAVGRSAARAERGHRVGQGDGAGGTGMYLARLLSGTKRGIDAHRVGGTHKKVHGWKKFDAQEISISTITKYESMSLSGRTPEAIMLR